VHRLALLFFVAWLALAPVAANGQVAVAPGGAPVDWRISAPETVIRVGEWVTLTIAGGQPGLSGYLTSAMPLEHAAADGTPQPYPYRIVLDEAGFGQAAVRALHPGNARISFIAPAAGGEQTVGIVLAFYAADPPPPPPTGYNQPVAYLSAWAPYPRNARYLRGVPVRNRLTLIYDLKGKSGTVTAVLNGSFDQPLVRREVSGQGQFTFDVDMGADIFTLLNELRGVAVVDGQRYYQDQDPFFFTQIPGAHLIERIKCISPFHIEGEGETANYVADVEFPVDGMRFAAPSFISAELAKQTQHSAQLKGKFVLPLRCQGEGNMASLNGVASYGFSTQVYNVPLSGNVRGEGDLTGRVRNCNIIAPELEGKIILDTGLRGSYAWEMKDVYKDILGDYGPTLFSGIGRDSFGKVGLGGALDTHMEADALLSMAAPYFSSKLDMTAKLDLAGRLSTYVFPVMWLKADLNQTGGKLLYNAQARSSQFDKLYAGAGFGYHTDIWFGCVFGLCTIGTWKLEGGCFYSPDQAGAAACSAKPIQVTNGIALRPAPTDNYAVFRGDEAAGRLLSGAPSLHPVTQTLVSNVYTFTSASVAWDPLADRGLLVWDHDDLAKPDGGSAELRFSRWDGAGWSAPAAITENLLQDVAPQVVWASGDQAVAVWHQTRGDARATALAAGGDLTPALEIVAATYDAAADAWSAPTMLTDNTVADAGVRMARNAAGELLAAWAQSDNGFAAVEPGTPARVMAAAYDGAWAAPTVAIADAAGLADLAVGYGDGRAAIAYTRPYTPTGATWPLHQLFVVTAHGGGWSAPQPVTYDALDHRSPTVLYNVQGQPMLLWLAGDALRLLNLVTGAQTDLLLDPTLGAVNEVRGIQTQEGDIVAVLRGQGGQHDLWTAFYARAYALWGAPRPLTASPALEHAPAIALDAAGELRLAYAATAVETMPTTVTLPDGSSVPGTATVEGQTNLDVLRYRFDRNLTLAPDGLTVSADAAAAAIEVATTAGDVTLSAVVTNTGDLPLAGVIVSFYDGDPEDGGSLIEAVISAAPLPSGASRTLSSAYRPPANAGIKTLFAVAAAADQAADSDVSDNRASVRAFGPDLALESVRVSPDLQDVVTLAAVVRNIGASESLSTTLDLRLGAITGTLLAQFAVPPLQAGQAFPLFTPWDHGALPLGAHALWAITNDADFEEVNITNNHEMSRLTLGPNLTLDRTNAQADNLAGATVSVTVTVFNRGTASGPITIAFHRESPLLGGAALVSRTIGSLASGGSAQAQVDLSGPLGCGLYVTAEPVNGETDWSDNIVALASPTRCTWRQFLPLLLRQ
jgi:hypothetical protein